jgi:hypothetical protein
MPTATFLDELIDWPGAVLLVALAIGPELLPLIYGTGEHATGDWGFIYVTCHFVLLPLGSLFVLIGGAVMVMRGPAASRRRAILPAMVALGALIGLAVDPLPWLRAFYR